MRKKIDEIFISAFRRKVFAWFRANGRDLPWRRTRDPWAVLVSEVMLQQTQVDRVAPKYAEFMRRWPEPAALADARFKDVLAAWSGLGYNRRAVHLWNAAKAIAARGGTVPVAPEELETLPGLGKYTARAVASFAHNADVALWDTNVRRIFLRVFFGGEFARRQPPPTKLEALLEDALPRGRSRDWHGALMDFGSAVCLGRAPRCGACPLSGTCRAAAGFRRGAEPKASLIRKQPKFEGSRRQARGAIVRLLAREGRPVPAAELAGMAPDGEALIDQLAAEGLVRRVGERVTLP